MSHLCKISSSVLLLCLLLISDSSTAAPDTWKNAFNGVADITSKAAPSVLGLEVWIEKKRLLTLLYRDKNRQIRHTQPRIIHSEQKQGDGSAFIISADGYAVTNEHVIRPEIKGRKYIPSKIEAILSDGSRLNAKVIGYDEESDLAVIKLPGGNFQPIEWGDSSKVRPGHFALTIGSSLGAEHTVGFGVISAVSRKIPQFSKEALFGDLSYIQTYAQINPGNSGGPLINLDGQVIGIPTWVQIAPHSPGFAIPSNYAKKIVQEIIKNGRVKRPSLGLSLSISRVIPFDSGRAVVLIVSKIIPDGPADRAGMKVGDVIYRVNGQDIPPSIKDVTDLIRQIHTSPVSSKFKLGVYRKGKDKPLSFNIQSEDL